MIIEVNKRFMPVLTEEELEIVREILRNKMHDLFRTDLTKMSEEEFEATNKAYATLGDIVAKFATVYKTEQ